MCWWNDHSNARINNNTGHWPLVKIAINFESHVHTRTESEAGESTRLLLVKSDIEVADIGESCVGRLHGCLISFMRPSALFAARSCMRTDG
jgi:hypothetical protein